MKSTKINNVYRRERPRCRQQIEAWLADPRYKRRTLESILEYWWRFPRGMRIQARKMLLERQTA